MILEEPPGYDGSKRWVRKKPLATEYSVSSLKCDPTATDSHGQDSQ